MSWAGRYEGDTLEVVDTIGLNTRTYVDNFRTPHTDQLHVVERFRMVDDGRTMEVQVYVEDFLGAFTTPWNAIQRYRRIDANHTENDTRVPRGPLEEMVCAENNGDGSSPCLRITGAAAGRTGIRAAPLPASTRASES